MYQVLCDGYKIYDSRLDTYKIFNVGLELELNKTGSFVFDIYPTHPHYKDLHKLKSIIEIIQDDYLIFRGRVLNDESGIYNQKHVVCEGELAFLLDSIMRPYGSTDEPWEGTPKDYLKMIIDNHNSQVDDWKKFELGIVTVTATASTGKIQRSDSEYRNSWDLISEKLVGSLGGYLWVDFTEEGKRRLNYLADFTVDSKGEWVSPDSENALKVGSDQKVEFGKNLLDIKKTIKGEEVMTAIIPLGGKPEGSEERLTIKDIANYEEGGFKKQGDCIVHTEAVKELGFICKIVTWDDITTDINDLNMKAKKHLAESVMFPNTIELTAADLSGIKKVNPFRLGRYLSVKSPKHSIGDAYSDVDFLVEKLSLNILNPASNKLTVGTKYLTFTESTKSIITTQGQVVDKVNKIEKNVAGYVTQEQLNTAKTELTEQNSTAISQSESKILTQVSQDYYLKEDADSLVQSVNSQFTQTSEMFEMKFSEVSQGLNELSGETYSRFQELVKYIRFENGDIVLGEVGNEIVLRIENDRIAFLQNGLEVAYFSNRKLYVIDGEFLGTLKLGNYAFEPQEDGSLTFGLVEE